MGGLINTIKEKSKNRLARLEHRRPTHTERGGILITEEAENMLEPWRKALERLDGHTLHYEVPPQKSGIICSNCDTTRSIIISEAVWFKALGDALVDKGEEHRLAFPQDKYPMESKIDANVAHKAINALKAFGISI